jgi:dCTP diphosphatase
MSDHDPAGESALDALRLRLRDFAAERDWEPFHTPKNLAMALACEAAEVMEHFLWLDGEASGALPDAKRAAVAEELADVLIYLVRLADRLDVDLLAAAVAKVARNAERYPADKVRGRAVKYDEL